MCCQGYQRDAHIVRKCNPICQAECVNGICFSPNECICYPDHVKNLAGFCVPTCPIGEFEINVFQSIQYETFFSMTKRSIIRTEKIKEEKNLHRFPGCDNGDCRENTCVCKPGFALDKTGKFCAPVCDPACGKGDCTAPNTCSCNRGYELTESGACIPKCTNGCDYGECIAPEKCACRPGFILQNSICSPVCEK